MTPNELEARKKKKPYRQTDLRRRKYRKIEEEEHAMDKPKKLEVQTDGDLSEVKKDPVWKTYLDKAKKKRVRLGDISTMQKLPTERPSKHKDPKEWHKWKKRGMGKGDQLQKRGEDMGDKVQHPTEDKDWMKKLKPSTLEYLRETPSGVNPKRPDINEQEGLGNKVQHPQSETSGMKPVREGDKPQRTTPSGLKGPMGAGETLYKPRRRRGRRGDQFFTNPTPVNLAMIQLVKFSLRRKKPKGTAWSSVHSGKPTGIPESPGNADQYNHPYKPREVPKPKDKPYQKITTTPYKEPEKPKQALPKVANPVGAGGKKTPEREQEETNVAMGKLDKPKKTTSPIENVDRSFNIWKRALDETGESDVNQAKGEKIQAHPPLGSEEYETTDADGNVEIKRRKIVKPSDKPHKVADPLHPYTQLSGGFVQGEKFPNLIDSDQNVLGQTPSKHDKEVKPSNKEPVESPKVKDPKKRTNVPKAYVTKPIPDSKGGRGSFQHCINANQDKNNPGGWCKQIERKVEGKSKGRTSRDRKRRQQEYVEAETANLKDKTDYFVEEIRANIIYENKIAPLVGMLAGGVARAVGGVGKKVVQAGREMAKPQEGEEE